MITFNRIKLLLEDSSIANKTDSVKGVSVEGIHYSHLPNLSHLEGNRSGTGITGSEQKRLADSNDPRIKKRIYFYNKTDRSFPKPEQGLGPHIHSAMLKNIYDPTNASLQEKEKINAHKKKYSDGYHHPSNTFESSVVDAGYSGYTNNGATVILGKDKIHVKYHNDKI